jgi:hypothetical protein
MDMDRISAASVMDKMGLKLLVNSAKKIAPIADAKAEYKYKIEFEIERSKLRKLTTAKA